MAADLAEITYLTDSSVELAKKRDDEKIAADALKKQLDELDKEYAKSAELTKQMAAAQDSAGTL